MKKIMHVFDLDGVLIDSTARYRVGTDGKIDLQYWRDMQHRAYELDRLLPLHSMYLELLQNPNVYVAVATARELHDPDDCFIRDFLGTPPTVISRKQGDSRSGGLLKVLGLRKLLALRQFASINEMHVWEDNHTYCKTICDAFADRYTVHGHYIPSKQGH